MPTDPAKIATELSKISKSLDKLVDLQKQQIRQTTRTRPLTLTFPNTLAELPVKLDWNAEGINGVAEIVESEGIVRISVVIDRDQTDIVCALVPQLDIKSLLISAMGDD